MSNRTKTAAASKNILFVPLGKLKKSPKNVRKLGRISPTRSRVATLRNGAVPMQAYEELFALAERLKDAAAPSNAPTVRQPLDALNSAAEKVRRSFSGSWLG